MASTLEQAEALIGVLSLYGECHRSELPVTLSIQAREVLTGCPYLKRASEEAWVASDLLLQGLASEPDGGKLKRKVLFACPLYHQYLAALVAVQLAYNAANGADEAVAETVVEHFEGAAAGMNAALDQLEREFLSVPLKAATPGQISSAAHQLLLLLEQERGIEFMEWDKHCFGIADPPEAVLQAIVARGALRLPTTAKGVGDGSIPCRSLVEELQSPSGARVMFPALDESSLSVPPMWGSSWLARNSVFSSIPLFSSSDDKGQASVTDVQNAFMSHPVPWLLIQLLALQNVEFSVDGATKLCLIPVMSDEEMLTDIQIEQGYMTPGTWNDLFPMLLDKLGFTYIEQAGADRSRLLNALVQTMRRAGIIGHPEKRALPLDHEFFLSLFEQPRHQAFKKHGTPYREKLLRWLDEVANHGVSQ